MINILKNFYNIYIYLFYEKTKKTDLRKNKKEKVKHKLSNCCISFSCLVIFIFSRFFLEKVCGKNNKIEIKSFQERGTKLKVMDFDD